MVASTVICTNCRIIVVSKTFNELISMVFEVRSIVVMNCRYECFIGGNYNQGRIEHPDLSTFGGLPH